jgi:transposase
MPTPLPNVPESPEPPHASPVFGLSGLNSKKKIGTHCNKKILKSIPNVKMEIITREVNKQAHENTKFHAVHAYLFLQFSLEEVAFAFSKTRQTISNWVKQYSTYGHLKRLTHSNDNKYGPDHKQYIKELVMSNPLLYLKEIKQRFQAQFKITISVPTIYRILVVDLELTRKKVERRSLDIRFSEISRFTKEVNEIRPPHQKLIFLDEVSLDGKNEKRPYGWFSRGVIPSIQGKFKRDSRVSLLTLISCDGIVDCFQNEGTFDRKTFLNCLRSLVSLRTISIGSVIVLDGAKIHTEKNLVHYLRSLGLMVLFLPAYCPFYNPIEIFFHLLKLRLKSAHNEKEKRGMMEIMESVSSFTNYNFSPLFKKCGYDYDGYFYPFANYDHEEEKRKCESQPENTEDLLNNELHENTDDM